jgi:hypothetical protein
MTRLEAEEIIAAVSRGTKHGAISWLRQHLRSRHQQRRRQGRTVGIQHDGAGVPEFQQLIDGAVEAAAEIRPPGFEQTDIGGQHVPEERDRFRPRRTIRHVRLDRQVSRRLEDVGADVL